MLQLDRSRRAMEQPRFAVGVATKSADVEQALRLRWQVFVEEQGASPEAGESGLETDRFDAHCHHLVVRDLESGMAVGTYRVLMPDRAERLGGFYTEQEFDLCGLAVHRRQIVEIGRSCVHRDYRSGVVIAMLWTGLAGLILGTDARFVIGCASISLSDGGREAAGVFRRLEADHMCTPEYRVVPKTPLQLDTTSADISVKPPPLIKGYLRAGAEIAGFPAVDVAFGTADLPMLLTLDRLAPRYQRHFTGA
ncbi:MAG: GNAT family N-acyltransferase [Hyphomicrobiaceae bacterium]